MGILLQLIDRNKIALTRSHPAAIKLARPPFHMQPHNHRPALKSRQVADTNCRFSSIHLDRRVLAVIFRHHDLGWNSPVGIRVGISMRDLCFSRSLVRERLPRRAPDKDSSFVCRVIGRECRTRRVGLRRRILCMDFNPCGSDSKTEDAKRDESAHTRSRALENCPTRTQRRYITACGVESFFRKTQQN